MPPGPRKTGRTGQARPFGPAELVLAASVARRFYLDGRSKVEIASEFGLSRFKIARILEAAAEHGIVRIEINLPAEIDADLSDGLRTRYGLRHAIVVSARPDDPTGPESVTSHLGPVAAGLLTELVEEDDVLGLAWGRAISAVGASLTELAPCTVVQLTGVHSLGTVDAGSVEAVRRAAAVSGGEAFPIYAPLLLPDPTTAATLRGQSAIAEVFDQFHGITKAVVAIGAWGPTLSTVYDALDEAERAAYRDLGVRAEMSAHLFDADGKVIGTELTDRVISIGVEELRAVPEVIGVAGGVQKADAIAAVLRSGLLTTLVTDESAARHLLRPDEGPDPRLDVP